MNNIDSRFLFPFGENSSALQLLKLNQNEQTTRKQPFKDATNKAALGAIPKSSENEIKKKQPVTKESETIDTDDDFDEFKFPPDQNCFCCGKNRKTDGELYFERLIPVLDEILMMNPRIPEIDDFSHELTEKYDLPDPRTLLKEPEPSEDIAYCISPLLPLEEPSFESYAGEEDQNTSNSIIENW